MSNVLVVDDSATMRRILSKSLVSCGVSEASISTASNGRAALEQIEEECPQLLLCDVAMPVLDGIGLMKELSQRGYAERCHILFVTSLATDAIREELLSLGANAVLPKPFNPTQLRRNLRPYLELTRAPANQDVESLAPAPPPLADDTHVETPTAEPEQADERETGGLSAADPLAAQADLPDHERPTSLTIVHPPSHPGTHREGEVWIPDGPIDGVPSLSASESTSQPWDLWLSQAISKSVAELMSEMLFADAVEVQAHAPNDSVIFIGEVDLGPDRRDRLRVAATSDTAAFASRAMLGIDGEPNDIERCDTLQEIANIIGGALVRSHEGAHGETDWSLGIANSSVTAPGQHVMHGARAFRWGTTQPLFVSYVPGWR